MNQLAELLKIFEYEIQQLINKEKNPREFYLLKNDEIGKLTYIIQDIGNGNLEIIYNRHIIEVYYNSLHLTNNYIQKPHIADEILIKIFKYLAHHEYGHSIFCDSTLTNVNFREKYKDSIFNYYDSQLRSDLRDLFWILFHILRDFYADFQAKKINPIIPQKIILIFILKLLNNF